MRSAILRSCLPPSRGHLETVRVLLRLGSDIDFKGHRRHTALMKAAAAGHVEVVQFLLEGDANPAIRSEDGQTAASLAQRSGQTAVVAVLEAHAEQSGGLSNFF